MSDFIVRDSGARQSFETGARRDTQDGKPRYGLLPVKALTRWALHMVLGAEKYGDRNWEKGMPTSRFMESALRHVFDYKSGDRTEDHLAAVLFNIAAIMHFENGVHDDLNGDRDGVEEAIAAPSGSELDSDDENLLDHAKPSTFVDSHGNLQYVSVNQRIAQLSIPGFPAPDQVGAAPKC